MDRPGAPTTCDAHICRSQRHGGQEALADLAAELFSPGISREVRKRPSEDSRCSAACRRSRSGHAVRAARFFGPTSQICESVSTLLYQRASVIIAPIRRRRPRTCRSLQLTRRLLAVCWVVALHRDSHDPRFCLQLKCLSHAPAIPMSKLIGAIYEPAPL